MLRREPTWPVPNPYSRERGVRTSANRERVSSASGVRLRPAAAVLPALGRFAAGPLGPRLRLSAQPLSVSRMRGRAAEPVRLLRCFWTANARVTVVVMTAGALSGALLPVFVLATGALANAV